MAKIMVLLDHGPVVPCDGCGLPVCSVLFGERGSDGAIIKRESWVCEVPDRVPAAGRVPGLFAGLSLVVHNRVRCREAIHDDLL